MDMNCTNCKYLKEHNAENDYCICGRDGNGNKVPCDFECDFYIQKKPSGAMRRKSKKAQFSSEFSSNFHLRAKKNE